MILGQVETNSQTISTGTDGGPLAQGSALSYRIRPAWPDPANAAVIGQGAPYAGAGSSLCSRGAKWFPLAAVVVLVLFLWGVV